MSPAEFAVRSSMKKPCNRPGRHLASGQLLGHVFDCRVDHAANWRRWWLYKIRTEISDQAQCNLAGNFPVYGQTVVFSEREAGGSSCKIAEMGNNRVTSERKQVMIEAKPS